MEIIFEIIFEFIFEIIFEGIMLLPFNREAPIILRILTLALDAVIVAAVCGVIIYAGIVYRFIPLILIGIALFCLFAFLAYRKYKKSV